MRSSNNNPQEFSYRPIEAIVGPDGRLVVGGEFKPPLDDLDLSIHLVDAHGIGRDAINDPVHGDSHYVEVTVGSGDEARVVAGALQAIHDGRR